MNLLVDNDFDHLARAWPNAHTNAEMLWGMRGSSLVAAAASCLRLRMSSTTLARRTGADPHGTIWWDSEPHVFDDLLEVRTGGDRLTVIDAGPYENLHIVTALPCRLTVASDLASATENVIDALSGEPFLHLSAETDLSVHARNGRVVVAQYNSLSLTAPAKRADDVLDALRPHDFSFPNLLACGRERLQAARIPPRVQSILDSAEFITATNTPGDYSYVLRDRYNEEREQEMLAAEQRSSQRMVQRAMAAAIRPRQQDLSFLSDDETETDWSEEYNDDEEDGP